MRLQGKKILSFVVSLSLLLGLFLTPVTSIASASDTVTITILGTSDMHGALNSWSYENNRDYGNVGLERIHSLVKQVKAENPNTLLIDNGDTVQGSILTDDLYNSDLSKPNPMMDVMNAVGYDAMTLGNHEFNFGLELVDKMVKEANFPILSANIYKKADGSNYVKPYVIKEVAGVKVGIIGLTVPSIPRWDGPRVTDLEFKHMAEEAKKYVEIVKQEGADVIIATAHSGLDSRHEEDGSDSARKIVEYAPEIAALLVGHDHSTVNETINGVLVGAPAAKSGQAIEVVKFDITLQKDGESWKVTDKKTSILQIEDYESSEEIVAVTEKYHNATLDFLKDTIGVATDDFHPESEVPGIPEAQIRDTAVIDIINEVQLKYTGAEVAAAALFKNDSNLPKGDINYANIFDIYKYANKLVGVEVTGKELKNYMEWSAAYYNTYKPGDITVSFNPDIRGYNYDMFAGVDYKVDISKPVGERIVDLTFKGEPIKDDQTIKLAINDYRYSGLINMGIISNEPYFNSDPISLRSYIKSFIEEKGTISPQVDNNWEITGVKLDHWAKPDAIKLLQEGLITVPTSKDGRTPNVESVNLDEKVTRGEYIKVLVKALKLPVQNIEASQFEDVDASLAPYVDAAVKAGITNGVSDTKFGTDNVINREQAFSMLIRAIYADDNYDQTTLNQFKDNNTISSWAKEELAAAIHLGIVSGYTDGTIRPSQQISRGEMASIASKYMDRFKRIDILSTNDFHGNLEGGYEAGAAKLAAYIDFYKSGNPEGTLVLDAGDAFQGTPLSNLHRGKPVVESFELMGYDAMVVGNHEFDWGIEAALESLENGSFKLLSANIYQDDKLVDWATPYTIVDKDGLKVGIIGFSTPETAITAHADFVGEYEFKDPIAIANELIPVVKGEGADIIILLGHLPGKQDRETKVITGELADLANGVEGADAAVGGHSHEAVAGIVNGMPVVEAYKNGRMVGHITLVYDNNDNKVIGKNSEVIEVRKGALNIEPVAEVQAVVDKYNEELAPIFNEVVGKAKTALVRDYNNESNIGNWLTDTMKEQAGVQIAFTNAGGIREDIQAGDITVRDIFTVMPFDNTIVKGEMTGAQLKAVLEQSVTLYKGMLQISGMKFTYDSTKPEGERVIDIQLSDGTAIDMEASYTVATNDFLSGGQDGFVTLKEVEWSDTFILQRDALLDDIKAKGEINPEIEGRCVDVSKLVSYILYNLPLAS